MAHAFGDLVAERKLALFSEQIGKLNRLLFEHGTAGKRIAADRHRVEMAYRLRGGALRREVPQHVAFDEIHRGRSCIA